MTTLEHVAKRTYSDFVPILVLTMYPLTGREDSVPVKIRNVVLTTLAIGALRELGLAAYRQIAFDWKLKPKAK